VHIKAGAPVLATPPGNMPFCGGAKERRERLGVDSVRDEHPPRQRILHELSP
jgi:hypothetical protein